MKVETRAKPGSQRQSSSNRWPERLRRRLATDERPLAAAREGVSQSHCGRGEERARKTTSSPPPPHFSSSPAAASSSPESTDSAVETWWKCESKFVELREEVEVEVEQEQFFFSSFFCKETSV